MSEIARTYLGNWRENVDLKQQVERARLSGNYLEVHLNPEDNLKSRIYAKSSTGVMVGIIKQRDWQLKAGDVFETEQEKLAIVHLQAEQVMVLKFSTQAPGYEVALVHLGHILGNHHHAIAIAKNKIYVQLAADKEVLEATIRSFNIPGLSVAYEARLPAPPLLHSHHSHD